MVLFNLKKDAGQVRQLMANSLVDICRGSFKYEQELNIEGMLCITLDKQDVLPIPVNIQLQKKARASTNSDVLTSAKDSNHAKNAAPLEQFAQTDLQSAQAVLQSLLAKSPANHQPEFIPLGDMHGLAEGQDRAGQQQQQVKLEAVTENNDVEMDEDREDSDEGIQISQGSQQSMDKAHTLQDAVGNVIKSFYQESTSPSSVALQQATTEALTSVPQSLPQLAVIKVVKPATSVTTTTASGKALTPQQKLSNSLPWKHEAPKKFQCPMCTYTSDRRFCINRHMKLHVGRAGVQCTICHNIFADHWYLTKVHMPKHHPEVASNNSPSSSKKPTSALSPGKSGSGITAKECCIKCPVCPFTASTAISFRNHLNTHSRDCLKCGLRFLTPSDVQQHVHQHHGEDVDLSEYIYDPSMADHLEDDAIRNAVHLTPTNSGRASTVEPDGGGGGSAQCDQATAEDLEITEGELEQATALYTQDEDGEQVPLLMHNNYMMVVNDANHVEIHASDGTVVEGIVSEDGQVYTTQQVEEVDVSQLIKKEGGGGRDGFHNAEDHQEENDLQEEDIE